eukprot:1988539-Amphidinium_carterae.1
MPGWDLHVAQLAMGHLQDRGGTMACRLNGPEPIIHAADNRSNVQLPDGVDGRKRNQQGEAQSD